MTEPQITLDRQFLTPAEFSCLDSIADVFKQFCRLSERAESREWDLREVAQHIHALQNWILANAAARAYPGQFRTLGGVVREENG